MLPRGANECGVKSFLLSELVFGRKMRQFGRLFRHIGKSFVGLLLGPLGQKPGDSTAHRSSRILWSRNTSWPTEAKDAATGRKIYAMVDWYKDYASKFGAVLNQNPSTGNKAGGLLNITIKSLGVTAKAGHNADRGLYRVRRNATRPWKEPDAGSGRYHE